MPQYHRLSRLTLLALLLIVLAAPLPTLAQGPEALPTTLDQVQSVILPPRDLLDLATRLDGITTIPAPLTAPAQTWEVGDETMFWADNLETDEKFQLKATLRYITDATYIWVQSDQIVDQTALERSADVFALQTYPIVHEAFGTEWLPGVDGDPRLYILHATGLGSGVAAYFASDSSHPTAAVPSSNGHEMFFVNLDAMGDSIGTPYYDGVLAHEFQHMVHWNNDRNEDSWLDEGMAELASLLTGFDRQGFASYYLRQPATQLTTWPEIESTIPHYGASFMFATYFHERFGDEGTRQLVQSPANGFQSVDETLAALNVIDPLTGQPISGLDVFADWTAANLINNPDVADGRFGYTLLIPTLGTMTPSETIKTYPAAGTVSVPQYSAHYIELGNTGPGQITLTFDGSDTVQLIPTDAYDGARMWYSNRGDTSDSRLTRAFDLRDVSSATLNYALWFDIENLWDYGYVMISTNDGATWTILETPHTTDDDPHQNAYGPGYTGDSGGATGPVWVQEQIDLTPFVGQEVLVRFEVITDEAVNTPGMAIDAVSIPAIDYAEDFEAGPGGWQSEGWLYIDNVLPQDWIVQVVQRSGTGTTVERLLMPGNGSTGTWTIELGGQAGMATLIVSPIAPITTEPGAFSYTLERVE
jgi:immune inhibitor A